jgi:hypothetical protein
MKNQGTILMGFIGFIFLAGTAFAGTACYQLQGQKVDLCVQSNSNENVSYQRVSIAFKDQVSGATLIQLNDFAQVAKGLCVDCNQNFYSFISNNLANSHIGEMLQTSIQILSPIVFNGQVNTQNVEESGFVQIGTQSYAYTAKSQQPVLLGQNLAH